MARRWFRAPRFRPTGSGLWTEPVQFNPGRLWRIGSVGGGPERPRPDPSWASRPLIDGALWTPPGRRPLRLEARRASSGVRLEVIPAALGAGGWTWIGQALAVLDLPVGPVEASPALPRPPSPDAWGWLRRERPLCAALEEAVQTEGIAVRGGPWGADLLDDASGALLARVEIGPEGAVARFAPGVLPIAAPEDHPWPEAWRVAVLAHRTRAIRAALGLCAPDARVPPWLDGWHRADALPTGPWRAGLPGGDPFSPGRLAGQIAGASAA